MDNDPVTANLNVTTNALLADISGDIAISVSNVADLVPGQVVATVDTSTARWGARHQPTRYLGDILTRSSIHLYVVVSTTKRAVLDPITRPYVYTDRSWAALTPYGNPDAYERIGDSLTRDVYPLGLTLDELNARVAASPAYPAYAQALAAARAASEAAKVASRAERDQVAALNAPYGANADAVNKALNWDGAVKVRPAYDLDGTPRYELGAPLHVLSNALTGIHTTTSGTHTYDYGAAAKALMHILEALEG